MVSTKRNSETKHWVVRDDSSILAPPSRKARVPQVPSAHLSWGTKHLACAHTLGGASLFLHWYAGESVSKFPQPNLELF